MSESLRDYCFRYNREDLLQQWHPRKNGTVTPEVISRGSHKPIWWICPHGHEWESPAYARAGKNTGCPYCAGKKVAAGQDLRTLYPDIAAQWHPTKNAGFRPDQVTPGSRKTVWWQCRHGHQWPAMVKTRVEGSNCPVCANRTVIPGVNDLQTTSPETAKQWHPTKNGNLTPSEVLGGSPRKVWWICEHGHEWQAAIYTRTKGCGCPVCSGKKVIPGENDLRSQYPALAEQWVQEKNGSLTPDEVTVSSNKKVWWRCERGHEWQSAVAARTTKSTGCPYCTGRKVLEGFNDLKTVQPLVAAQWHPTLNAPLEPTMVMPGSSRKVWWRCSDGHEWKAIIFSRTGAKKCGCPVCAGRVAKRV